MTELAQRLALDINREHKKHKQSQAGCPLCNPQICINCQKNKHSTCSIFCDCKCKKVKQ